MDKLREFVLQYSERGTCRCGKCVDHTGEDKQPTGHTIDMVFFDVCTKYSPDAGVFRQLIAESKQGHYCELDPFDGKEHSYIEVGAWIGDQGLAMQFMGLGHLLGLWKVFTPKMLRGLPPELVQMMAGQGMIAIMPPETTTATTTTDSHETTPRSNNNRA